jgi:hypothetical protein
MIRGRDEVEMSFFLCLFSPCETRRVASFLQVERGQRPLGGSALTPRLRSTSGAFAASRTQQQRPAAASRSQHHPAAPPGVAHAVEQEPGPKLLVELAYAQTLTRHTTLFAGRPGGPPSLSSRPVGNADLLYLFQSHYSGAAGSLLSHPRWRLDAHSA